MRIYMQSTDYADKTPRYAQIVLQQDLLGGWSLLSESGHQSRRGRMKQEHYETREQALDAMMDLRDSYINKGFRVVFMQGEAGG